jgi:hypothetical protein
MDYRVASNIRGKSISSLITDRISSGGSVGSSIKGAISDKLKAKGTGIKEKFDPMNIARAMTGGGKLAPAILGRITGRSQSDINYFAGDKKKSSSYTRMPSVGQVPSEGFGGSAVEVLNKMLSFMQKNREDDLKRKQISMSFEEERQSEEQRRHGEFLKVLKDFTSVGGTTTIVKKEEEGMFEGLLGRIKSMISSAIANVMEVISKLKTVLAPLLEMAAKLGTFVGSRLFGLLLTAPGLLAVTSLTALAALLFLAKAEKEEIEADPYAEKYKDNPYAMKLRGEATTIGQATVVNQNKALKQFPRRTVEDFVNSNRSDEELKLDLGNDRPTLKKWLADNPNRDAMYQAPVAAIAGQPQTAIPAGGKPATRLSLPEDVTPSTAGAGRGSAESAATDPRRLDLPTPTTTPVPEMPASSAVVGKIQENNDLNMQATMTAGAPSSPTVSVNNSSTSAPDQTVTATATTRDDTPILDLVLKRAKAQV